jgi:hypothetical protein
MSYVPYRERDKEFLVISVCVILSEKSISIKTSIEPADVIWTNLKNGQQSFSRKNFSGFNKIEKAVQMNVDRTLNFYIDLLESYSALASQYSKVLQGDANGRWIWMPY